MNRAYRILLIVACFAFAAGSVQAQRSRGPAPGSIHGVVLAADGKAAAGASVVLQASEGRGPRAVKADAEGRFTSPPLRPGLYHLRAQSKGRSSPWERFVQVRSGQDASVTLQLVAAPPPPPKTAAKIPAKTKP